MQENEQQQPAPVLVVQQVPATREQSAAMNVGAVAIEQERAIAEAQGQLTLAKKFPRNLTAAHAELMEACANNAFALSAFYSVPNRGSGPSIRFAEEVARVYGNFQYGHRELSRGEGKSEIEVFAWDMEKNNRSVRQITVEHIRDTRDGPKKLHDQADIDNRIANVASKQIRGRILALMPKWLVQDAIERCKGTLAGNTAEPISARVRKMVGAFSRFGVTLEHIERQLKHPIDDTTLDELADLQGIFNALREGAKPSEYFGSTQPALTDPQAPKAEPARRGRPPKVQQEPQGEAPKQAKPAEQEPPKTEPPKQAEKEPAPLPMSDDWQESENPAPPQAQQQAAPAAKAPAAQPPGKLGGVFGGNKPPAQQSADERDPF